MLCIILYWRLVLIFVDCIVLSSLFCLCVVFFSDKFHVRLLYDRIMDLRNYICMYVFMYHEGVCIL